MHHRYEMLLLCAMLTAVLSCGSESVPDLPPGVHDLHLQILSAKPGEVSGPVRVVYLTSTALDDARTIDDEARKVLIALSKAPMFAKAAEAWVYPCDNTDCAEHSADREALKYRRSGSGSWLRGGGEE